MPANYSEQWEITSRSHREGSPARFFNGPLLMVLLLVSAHSTLVDAPDPKLEPSPALGYMEMRRVDLGPVQESVKATPLFKQGQWLWVVSKATKSLNVYYFDGRDWRKKKSFPMIYGEVEGDKQKMGDMKTPEGQYWVNEIFPGSERGDKFGALVFSLNFPNKHDRARGVTGAGIWIHGPESGKGLDPSRGCVKLRNQDLLELLKDCRGPIPVEILPLFRLDSHPSQLDLEWVTREYPLWHNRYERSSFLSVRWRTALYHKVRQYIQQEESRKTNG